MLDWFHTDSEVPEHLIIGTHICSQKPRNLIVGSNSGWGRVKPVKTYRKPHDLKRVDSGKRLLEVSQLRMDPPHILFNSY